MEEENKPKITSKVIKYPLYLPEDRIKVWIVDKISNVQKSIRKDIDSHYGHFDYDNGDLDALVYRKSEDKGKHQYRHVIFVRKYLTPGLIAHEAVHIKNMMFDAVGIINDLNNDEPEAYFMGWLVDAIHEVVAKDKENHS
jgi:hypothetical protein